jgi:hypothetical protein
MREQRDRREAVSNYKQEAWHAMPVLQIRTNALIYIRTVVGSSLVVFKYRALVWQFRPSSVVGSHCMVKMLRIAAVL